MKRLLTFGLAFLLMLSLVTAAPHPDYPAFGQAHSGFSVSEAGVVIANDNAVYNTGFHYAPGTAGWETYTFTGNTFQGASLWIAGAASASLSPDGSPLTEGRHFIIAYSCSRVDNSWDCHDGQWQLQIVDIGEEPEINEIIDCGSSEFSAGNMDDFDCLIEASVDCTPAKLLHTISVDFFGLFITTTNHMEIKGLEADKCIYYQRVEDSTVEFTEETVQLLLDEGATQEEIDEEERLANEEAQSTIGMEQTCKFETADLTALLNTWKEGSFSTGDWEGAECEGDFDT